MKINEVIKKYRKEVNLTQEQIANYLGVTAPAVNKWENGNSYPDITLLAPLARVLNINVDTLVSFNEELTDKEINKIVQELSVLAQKEGFIKAFKKAEVLIKEYACCDMLIISVAQILNAYMSLQEVDNVDKYEKRIYQWYEMVINSTDQKVVAMATVSLVGKYAEKKEFEKAQQLLDKIPSLGYDKRQVQAMLFYKQGKKDEAFEIYEQLLHQGASNITGVLHLLVRYLIIDSDFDRIPRYVNVAKQVAKLFDLGAYIENTPDLFVAIAKKDKEESLVALEKMVSGIDSLSDYTKSDLYTHIQLKEKSDSGFIKNMIKRGLESDDDLEFLKEDVTFKNIIKRLE
jgi:transcriptional regulator with XRE-family HTH domain